jgi:hypothetical protein
MASSSDTKIVKALDVIFQYGGIDGGHHKQWVLDQVVRALTGEDYPLWLAKYKAAGEEGDAEMLAELTPEEVQELDEMWDGTENDWDTGIAP